MPTAEVIQGDCVEVLRGMDAGAFDSVCTDPPYGLEFMGRKWDHGVPAPEVWAEVLRALKPGGYMLAMGGTRTYHRLACAVEDAGFEIRDCIFWLHAQGFPKGKGCLKPAVEPVLLCRKPGPKVLPLGIDECRVPCVPGDKGEWPQTGRDDGRENWRLRNAVAPTDHTAGRWPANVCHDGSDEVLAAFAAFGERASGQLKAGHKQGGGEGWGYGDGTIRRDYGGDTGTAARFFYCSKAGRAERLAAADGTRHTTQKPLALMQWLVRLVTPPGGRVLDPFGGSGTTAVAALKEGRSAVLVEKEAAYVEIARKRIAEAEAESPLFAEVA